MDICDATDSAIEAMSEAARSHIDTKQEAPFTGNCLWCEEPTSHGRRWCCIECRDAWDKYVHRQPTIGDLDATVTRT